MTLEQLLSYQHLVVAIVISGLMTSFKITLNKVGVLEKTVTQAILPYGPMALGAVSGLIPGVIQADTMGFSICVGLALGAISGQVWKILKTKLSAIKGEL